jgi:thiol-disulfide isomerase/thioredoxin
VILIVLAATQLRGLFAAGWLGIAVAPGLGFRGVMQVLTQSLTIELGFLVLAALVLWIASGPKRHLGRAFDLACVAALPLLVVDLAATVVVRAFELHMPHGAGVALAGISYGWAGAITALAYRPARAASAALVPAPPAEVARDGKLAGLAITLVAVIGVVVQILWIASSMDTMRPMTKGDPAPAFALRSIGERGVLGAPVTLASTKGKVVVLDFWATWCNPCLKAMPKLDALARAHPTDVVVIAINLDDAAEARALWDERKYQIGLLADDGHVSSQYGVTTIPHSVVIDREGIVRMVARGGGVNLEASVATILAQRPL